MSRFKFFEDFNEAAMVLLDGASCTEVYLFSLRIFLYSNLRESGQKYIANNYRDLVHKDLEVVKFFEAASFRYEKIGDDMRCNKIDASARYKLFDNVIFPLIPMEALMAIECANKVLWHWMFSEDRSFLTISRGRMIEKRLFDKLHHLHTDYVEKSLNMRIVSRKRLSSFIERFNEGRYNGGEEKGFSLSLEASLKNILEFVGHAYIYQSQEILRISLLKFRAVINEAEYMRGKAERVWVEDENRSFDEIRVLRKNFKQRFSSKRIGSEYLLEEYIDKGIDDIAIIEESATEFDAGTEKKIREEICRHYFYNYTDEVSGENVIEPANLVEWAAPIGLKINGHYILVAPANKHTNRNPFRYAYVLVSRAPFNTYILDGINALLSEYYFSYLETQRNWLLNDLYMSLFDSSGVADFDQLEGRFIAVVENVLNKMVHITDAYSAAFWLYRPATKTLMKMTSVRNDEARDICESDESTVINVDRYGKKSLTCRAFTLQMGERYASYIRDIRLPDVIGFGNIPLRSQTVSELCIPFYYHGVVIGVMGFKSPDLRAFDNECERMADPNGSNEIVFYSTANHDKCVRLREDSFFRLIKSTLQHYYITLSEGSDAQHLSGLAYREMNLHELKNLVSSDISLDSHRDTISELLMLKTSERDDGYSRVQKVFFNVRRDRIDSYFSVIGNMGPVTKEDFTQEDNLGARLPIRIEESEGSPLMLNTLAIRNLRIIYKALLTNYFMHGDVNSDTLEVKYFMKSNTLSISQVFSSFFGGGKSWFVSPHREADQLHSGLFIVGALARQLGGHVFTDYDKYGQLKRFDIHINLRKFRGGSSEDSQDPLY